MQIGGQPRPGSLDQAPNHTRLDVGCYPGQIAKPERALHSSGNTGWWFDVRITSAAPLAEGGAALVVQETICGDEANYQDALKVDVVEHKETARPTRLGPVEEAIYPGELDYLDE